MGEPMTDKEKDFAKWCAEHDPHKFYTWARWLAVREDVLRGDHYECVNCKRKYHRYRAADTVHHVNHFKKRPDLALEKYYIDPARHTKRRNLVSLCHDCHEEAHGYRKRKTEAPLTEERWD
jgi:5-methylcytosine-specific restriction endonuclease McrA